MYSHKFIEALLNAQSTKTVYMWGTFGQPVTQALISSKTRQYPVWYNQSKQSQLKRLINTANAFDCVGLIKGILWGWTPTSAAKYCSSGVPDISADQMIKVCEDVSSSMKNISAGEVVWLPGHIGVYIGNGNVIESTPAWKDGVQITDLSARNWKAHGKLPWVEYTPVGVRLVVEGKAIPAEIQNGVTVASVRAIAEALGAAVAWDEQTRTVNVERG